MTSQRGHWDRGRPARSASAQDSTLRITAAIDPEESERAGRPRSQQGQARVLGVHYEGPFVNSGQCGALHRDYFRTFLRSSDLDSLPTLPQPGTVHMMTMAPEIEGGIELVRELNSRGWIISIGHTR